METEIRTLIKSQTRYWGHHTQYILSSFHHIASFSLNRLGIFTNFVCRTHEKTLSKRNRRLESIRLIHSYEYTCLHIDDTIITHTQTHTLLRKQHQKSFILFFLNAKPYMRLLWWISLCICLILKWNFISFKFNGRSKINENKNPKERREMYYRESKQDKNQLLWYYNPNWVSKTHSNIGNIDAHTQKPEPQRPEKERER